MFRKFFAAIRDWYNGLEPLDKPTPVLEPKGLAGGESVATPSSILSYSEPENLIGLPRYKIKELIELREFFELLNSKELIGFHNVKNDESRLYHFKHIFDYVIFSKDGFEFHFRAWESTSLGTTHFLTYYAYEVIPAVTQGHLFDDPTVLRKLEYKRHAGENLAYEKSGYMAKFKNPEHRKYLKAVSDKSIAHVLKLIEGLPEMDFTTIDKVPVFNKLWEQMDLPLDTGTEIVKL